MILIVKPNKFMLQINYLELFKNFPPPLAVFLIAMMPIAELRAAIPVALGIYKMSILSTFFYAVLGAILPGIFILYFIDPVSKYLMKHYKIFDRFFSSLFRKTRIKFEGNYARYGSIALFLFVALPLPFMGVWTGALAAFLFQIPRKRAISLIILGTIAAGLIVIILTQGTIGTISYII